MKLSRIIERERIGIKKLLVPSNSGLNGASPDPFMALGITMQDAGGNAYKSCFYHSIRQRGSGGLELKLKE